MRNEPAAHMHLRSRASAAEISTCTPLKRLTTIELAAIPIPIPANTNTYSIVPSEQYSYNLGPTWCLVRVNSITNPY